MQPKSQKLYQYFNRSEFVCKCGCGFDTVDAGLLTLLSDIREFWGRVVITSGCRCERYNRLVGGAADSQHLKAKAADIIVYDAETDRVIAPLVIYDWVSKRYPETYGIGLYYTFVHVDSRPTPARWIDGTAEVKPSGS